ncbi:MAG: hypothetical protein WAU70_09525, partial [Flavobacteriales bacterium]
MRGWRQMVFATALSFIGFSAWPQAYLTNGEVFDYDVGDVFHHTFLTQVNFQMGPPATQIDTVIAEQWTTGLDSAQYVISSWVYQPSPIIGFPPFLQHEYDTLWVTDLLSPPQHIVLDFPCPPVLDSVGADMQHCGRMAWVQYVAGDTCVESDYWISTFIAGCGGPYYDSYDPWTATQQVHLLDYYRKGIEECGTPLSIPTGLFIAQLSGINYRVALGVAPVPAREYAELTWQLPQGLHAVAQLNVISSTGSLVRTLPVDLSQGDALLDVRTLVSGVYYLHVVSEGTAVMGAK